ncbi:hypothetical protein C0995_000353, partial [Termitomyces sp. Mi166
MPEQSVRRSEEPEELHDDNQTLSPYYAATGTHPLLPTDIVEATYLQPPPDTILTSTDLISHRAIALQRRKEQLAKLHDVVFVARRKAALRFKKDFAATIHDFNFKRGAL